MCLWKRVIFMNNEDKEWLEKCIQNPDKYKIFVDNDMIFVVDANNDMDTVYHTFSNFGYDFVYDLLTYLKCNVEFV